MGSPNRFANLSPGAHALELFDENFDYIDGLESELGSIKYEILTTANPLRYGAVDDGATDCMSALSLAAAENKPVVLTGKSYVATINSQAKADSLLGILGRIHLLCDSFSASVAAGVYNFSSRINLNVTNGNRLKITGATPVTLNFSSLGSITSNGPGDHDVVWNLTSGSPVNVGDYLIISGLTGTDCKALEGCWKITAKASAAITVKNTCRQASLGSPTVSAATIRKPTTVFKFTNSMGFYVKCAMGADSGETSGLKNIAIVGEGAGSYDGVFLEYGASLSMPSCWVNGFGRFGIYSIYEGELAAQNVVVSGCASSGLYFGNGGMAQGVGGIFTGNGAYGVVAAYKAEAAVSNSNSSGNVVGHYATLDGSIVGRNAIAARNSNFGEYAEDSSTIDFTGGVAENNTTFDIKEADQLSRVIGGTAGTKSQFVAFSKVLKGNVEHNFGSISASSESSVEVSIPGVTAGGTTAFVTHNGARVPGLVLQVIPSTDKVTIYALNTLTGSSISVSNRTFYVTVFMH